LIFFKPARKNLVTLFVVLQISMQKFFRYYEKVRKTPNALRGKYNIHKGIKQNEAPFIGFV